MPDTATGPVEPLLRCRGLSVRRGGSTLLDRVELAIRPGEIVSLIGPNGAGKTTLLRAALGLIAPSGGEVRRRPGLRAGYMPQKLTVDPTLPLTAGRFLRLAGTVGIRPPEQVIADTGIGGLLDRAVQNLSGGEIQRLLLARALLRGRDLLVLDEPAQAMDVGAEAAMHALIARIRARDGTAVLVVSHDLHLVMSGTDRVVCLNRHVCCTGAPAEVERHPEFLSLFASPGDGGLVPYRHRHDHDHALDGRVTAAAGTGHHRG